MTNEQLIIYLQSLKQIHSEYAYAVGEKLEEMGVSITNILGRLYSFEHEILDKHIAELREENIRIEQKCPEPNIICMTCHTIHKVDEPCPNIEGPKNVTHQDGG